MRSLRCRSRCTHPTTPGPLPLPVSHTVTPVSILVSRCSRRSQFPWPLQLRPPSASPFPPARPNSAQPLARPATASVPHRRPHPRPPPSRLRAHPRPPPSRRRAPAPLSAAPLALRSAAPAARPSGGAPRSNGQPRALVRPCRQARVRPQANSSSSPPSPHAPPPKTRPVDRIRAVAAMGGRARRPDKVLFNLALQI